MPSDSLKALASFIFGLFFTALIYKSIGIEGWEETAIIGGAFLFVLLIFLVGHYFQQGILESAIVSGFLTAVIMVFFSVSFAMLMIAISLLCVAIGVWYYGSGYE